jgi:hypothetical protein
MVDERRVGLVVGREWTWPPAFIDEVSRRGAGVVAELARLDITRPDTPVAYDVLIDRISHEVPFYRSYLKLAALQGVTVINNPFMWSADDKFLGASLLTRLGVAHPRTVVLPNHTPAAGLADGDLANLEYPLNWQAIVDYVGLPAILKDAHGGGWKEVHRVDSLGELLHAYNQSHGLTMVLQEFIEWEHYVRCMCIGQDRILPMKYDPGERRYHVEHAHMSADLGATVVAWAQRINRALGYDMNTVEFAVRGGLPYAIDFMNPAPDMDIYSLTPFYFDWVVSAMADLAIDCALAPRPASGRRWDALLAGGRAVA